MELLRVQLLRGIFQTRIILSLDIELLHNISGRELREPLQSYDGYWLDLLEALVRFWRTLVSCFDFNEGLIVVGSVAGTDITRPVPLSGSTKSAGRIGTLAFVNGLTTVFHSRSVPGISFSTLTVWFWCSRVSTASLLMTQGSPSTWALTY